MSRGSQSSEFILVVLSLVGVFAMVFTGHLDGPQALEYGKWVVGAYVLGRTAVKATRRGEG